VWQARNPNRLWGGAASHDDCFAKYTVLRKMRFVDNADNADRMLHPTHRAAMERKMVTDLAPVPAKVRMKGTHWGSRCCGGEGLWTSPWTQTRPC